MSDEAIYLVVARVGINDHIGWVSAWGDADHCAKLRDVMQLEHEEYKRWIDDYLKANVTFRQGYEQLSRARRAEMMDARYEHSGRVRYDVVSVHDDPSLNPRPESKTYDEKWKVEQLSDAYRERLGLKPWDLFAREARQRHLEAEAAGLVSPNPDLRRRSGRTTRGMLEAIARAVVHERKSIHVRTPYIERSRGLAVAMRRYVEDLALNIAITLTTIDTIIDSYPDAEVYQDHYYAERNQHDNFIDEWAR